MNAELEQLRKARGSLQEFRLKLLSPSAEALDSGSADLQAAVECLKRLEPGLASRDRRSAAAERAIEAGVAGLRSELQQVNALFAAAGRFYEGWSRLIGSAADDGPANYTAHGRPAPSISRQSNNVVAIHG